MKPEEIQKALSDAGLSGKLFVTDISYAKPTTAWLTGKFYEYFLNWLEQNSLATWKENFDCDNFAAIYYAFGQACHAKANRPEQGILIGEIFYMQDSGDGHAINIAITEKGVIFIEPQNGQEKSITLSEKKSCWMIRF